MARQPSLYVCRELSWGTALIWWTPQNCSKYPPVHYCWRSCDYYPKIHYKQSLTQALVLLSLLSLVKIFKVVGNALLCNFHFVLHAWEMASKKLFCKLLKSLKTDGLGHLPATLDSFSSFDMTLHLQQQEPVLLNYKYLAASQDCPYRFHREIDEVIYNRQTLYLKNIFKS